MKQFLKVHRMTHFLFTMFKIDDKELNEIADKADLEVLMQFTEREPVEEKLK